MGATRHAQATTTTVPASTGCRREWVWRHARRRARVSRASDASGGGISLSKPPTHPSGQYPLTDDDDTTTTTTTTTTTGVCFHAYGSASSSGTRARPPLRSTYGGRAAHPHRRLLSTTTTTTDAAATTTTDVTIPPPIPADAAAAAAVSIRRSATGGCESHEHGPTWRGGIRRWGWVRTVTTRSRSSQPTAATTTGNNYRLFHPICHFYLISFECRCIFECPTNTSSNHL